MLGVRYWGLADSSNAHLGWFGLIRAMATGAAATVAAAEMIIGGEHHQAGVEIKVAGPELRPGAPMLPGPMKFPDALATDAGFVALFRRHTREEFVGKANARTPARTFIRRGCAELAIVPPAAQRTTLGRVVRWRPDGIMAIVGHKNQARLRRAIRRAPQPRNASESVVGSGTATSASISDLPLNTSMRT